MPMTVAAAMPATMRLDRFLWFARVTKTRAQAQAMAGAGRLRLDGRVVDRASASVRVGNIVAFAAISGRVCVLRVERLPSRRGPPAEAATCITDLTIDASVWPS